MRGQGPTGVKGISYTAAGNGVVGVCDNGAGAYGIWGSSSSGYAGYFSGKVYISGNLNVAGTLSKAAGSFKIDHPLDPANKYLYHSFVESPDMKNIYDGMVTTDGKGDATDALPDWFEALNQDFRYQLTPIGAFTQVMVSRKIKGNTFAIKTDKPDIEVSWQVTGIRHDAYAEAHRIPVEEAKIPSAQGTYLHPVEMGQPAAKHEDSKIIK